MTAGAVAAVAAVCAAGGRLLVLGDRLRVEAPAPLSAEVMDTLRARKAEVLALLRPAAAPTHWVDGCARLSPVAPPLDFPPMRWNLIVSDAAFFSDRWAATAVALGWTTLDLFGVGREAPYRRLDLMGLVAMAGGKEVVALTGGDARLKCADGTTQTFYRKPAQPGRVALWELE